jgi:circadian clock protein KaiB
MTSSGQLKLRLFVAGNAGNSSQAISNLNLLCRDHIPAGCEIEVVDVFKDPRRALSEKVYMTPTLIKLSPAPQSRIIGSLSQWQVVLHALGIEAGRP